MGTFGDEFVNLGVLPYNARGADDDGCGSFSSERHWREVL